MVFINVNGNAYIHNLIESRGDQNQKTTQHKNIGDGNSSCCYCSHRDKERSFDDTGKGNVLYQPNKRDNEYW